MKKYAPLFLLMAALIVCACHHSKDAVVAPVPTTPVSVDTTTKKIATIAASKKWSGYDSLRYVNYDPPRADNHYVYSDTTISVTAASDSTINIVTLNAQGVAGYTGPFTLTYEATDSINRIVTYKYSPEWTLSYYYGNDSLVLLYHGYTGSETYIAFTQFMHTN